MTCKQIDDAAVRRLGIAEDEEILLIVGRNNSNRNSASIDALIEALYSRGLSVCWYESTISRARRTIGAQMDNVVPAGARHWLTGKAPFQVGMRWLAKTIILLAHPRLWWFFVKRWEERHHTSTRQLRQFVKSVHARRIFVLSQSAGGIASSLIANDEPIEKLICFGYPFKHPDRDEEPRRTAHLQFLRKPFLIFQGEQDEYGRKADASRYVLSSAVTIEAIQATHDYDDLSGADFRRVLSLVTDFLEIAPR